MTRIAKWFGGVAVAVLFAAVCLAACGPSPPPTPQFMLRIGLATTQEYIPYFVMQERGFARHHGLQFKEASYPGGTPIINAMAAGSVDVSYVGSIPILTATERGLIPEKAIPIAANNFADPEHPGVAVLVGRSINTWKDLGGKQVAVSVKDGLNATAFRGRLIAEGVKDYSLVEIPFANMGLAVAGGNVEAAVVSEPFLTQSLLRGDGKLLGWIIGGPPFERIEFSLVVFRAEFHRENPEGVKAYLRAHLEAVRWMGQNPQAARSLLAKRLDLTREVGEKINLLRWDPDARNDPALLDSMQPMLVQLGMLKALIPAKGLYDERLLDGVLAERR